MKAYTMTVLIAQLFSVLLIIAGTRGDQGDDCGPNEEWQECGSPCVKTCDNRNASTFCITLCVSGCYCRENYTRESLTGSCIPTSECPGA